MQRAINVMNEHLRGEISAAETYTRALRRARDGLEVKKLHILRRNHLEAAESLSDYVTQSGGRPARKAGAWGKLTKTVLSATRLFGGSAALRTLREGERLGARVYEKAVRDGRLPGSYRHFVRKTLLRRQEEHVRILTVLGDSV